MSLNKCILFHPLVAFPFILPSVISCNSNSCLKADALTAAINVKKLKFICKWRVTWDNVKREKMTYKVILLSRSVTFGWYLPSLISHVYGLFFVFTLLKEAIPLPIIGLLAGWRMRPGQWLGSVICFLQCLDTVGWVTCKTPLPGTSEEIKLENWLTQTRLEKGCYTGDRL